MVRIREAKTEDSVSACNVLIKSIKKICAPYYEYDENIIKDWLSNKTPNNVKRWIESDNNYCVVAESEKGNIVGFACISGGEILLNYVIEDVIYKGVGKSMLKRLEEHAFSTGLNEIYVVSTISAKSFYERNGYVLNGDPKQVGNIIGEFPLIRKNT